MISYITPTHDPKYLRETYKSLLMQTDQDWEWIVVPNGNLLQDSRPWSLILGIPDKDPKIKIVPYPNTSTNIGAIKNFAFMNGSGDYLAELDHDDILSRDATADIHKAFREHDVDFVYSNTADFFPNGMNHYFPDWQKNGWRYRTEIVNDKSQAGPISFEPSAGSMSLIYYAPNHIRVWKKDFYHKIGGHNLDYSICDDHELVVRTYLKGRMYHIDKCLYLYRMGPNNTFSGRIGEISQLTHNLYVNNIYDLIKRESELTGYPIYDLGGGFGCPKGWKSVDLKNGDITADLNKTWPFEDNSVLAFRAHDIIEHLPDKQHVMSELHRCLKPGGWAMINVPSTDGRGAYQDPTHVSYWNENSFWYYTRQEQARYIYNENTHFLERRLFTYFPSDWHKNNKIPYVVAELQAIKGDMSEVPGYRRI